MNRHLFIFQSFTWLGEGTISFSAAKDSARFYTRWSVIESSPAKVILTQDVELAGVDQTLRNHFTITDITSTSFKIKLENESMGIVTGKGVVGPKIIAWELRDHPGVEGYESYELQENGDYQFHAEYASADQFRSMINGKIWRKL